jgi:hypothetical protein
MPDDNIITDLRMNTSYTYLFAEEDEEFIRQSADAAGQTMRDAYSFAVIQVRRLTNSFVTTLPGMDEDGYPDMD